MICIFHRWVYSGLMPTFRWLGGVAGGVKIETLSNAEKCEKCGKVRLLRRKL